MHDGTCVHVKTQRDGNNEDNLRPLLTLADKLTGFAPKALVVPEPKPVVPVPKADVCPDVLDPKGAGASRGEFEHRQAQRALARQSPPTLQAVFSRKYGTTAQQAAASPHDSDEGHADQ